jgi:serine protease Do
MTTIYALALAIVLTGAPPHREPFQPSTGQQPAFCRGAYADNILALAPGVRDIEDKPYSYCVRSTAIYECLSYGPDGNVKKARNTAIAHGTAFGYKHQSGNTLLLTNHHVSEWPLVTDETHPAGAVPNGCKKVEDTSRIVENESDNYAADDIDLTRVVQDITLDASILRAKSKLNILPWKLGKSASLRERNVVQVRGFPLGVFQATNDGKVISALDHDTDKEWDHDDFVIDALLSHGSSGSPVLAVSCETGEFELVGMFHAGYTGGNALNVVVGIDQLKDMMLTLKKRTTKTKNDDGAVSLDLVARARLMQQTTTPLGSFFPFGPNTALVIKRIDDTLLFAIYPREFPLASHPLMVIEDRLDATDFGNIGRIWFGSPLGLKEYGRGELDAEDLSRVGEVLDGLRRSSLMTAAYRSATSGPPASREAFDNAARLERALKRTSKVSTDLSDRARELADRFAPKMGIDLMVSAASVMTSTAVGVPATISLGETPKTGPSP